MADSIIRCNNLVPDIKENHGPESHTLETYCYGPVAPCQGNHNFTRARNHGICKYWELGRCREGVNCSFIHLRWKMLRDENSANGIKKVIDGIWYTNGHRDICRFREPVEQNPDGTLRYNGALLYTPHDHISIMFDPYQKTNIHRVLDCSVLNHLKINFIRPEDRGHHHKPLTAEWWKQWRFAAAKRMLWIQWLQSCLTQRNHCLCLQPWVQSQILPEYTEAVNTWEPNWEEDFPFPQVEPGNDQYEWITKAISAFNDEFHSIKREWTQQLLIDSKVPEVYPSRNPYMALEHAMASSQFDSEVAYITLSNGASSVATLSPNRYSLFPPFDKVDRTRKRPHSLDNKSSGSNSDHGIASCTLYTAIMTDRKGRGRRSSI